MIANDDKKQITDQLKEAWIIDWMDCYCRGTFLKKTNLDEMLL